MGIADIDWATDFDYLDDEFVTDPYGVWSELRTTCPVAHTERRGSTWMPTRYEDIAEVARDTEHFSSRDPGVIPSANGKYLVAPPITSDPPFHSESRRLLLPAFSPKAVDKLEPVTAAIADELIDAVIDQGHADAAGDYAQHLPVRVISKMLGLPDSDEAQFTDWATRILQAGQHDPEVGRVATREVLDYFREQVADTTGGPVGRPDLLPARGPHGRRSTHGEAHARHLLPPPRRRHRHDVELDRRQPVAPRHPRCRPRAARRRPDLIPTAIEEFLRAYAPVTMAREVVGEVEVNGSTMCPGDKVLLTLPSGNRDETVFDSPDEVVIDRERNRHFAFGVGIHRCLGSNLARMELQVAVERWLARIPSFRLVEGSDVRWNGGQVRGPRSIPVVFPA